MYASNQYSYNSTYYCKKYVYEKAVFEYIEVQKKYYQKW